MITTGFYYIAAVVAIPAVVCMLEAKTNWKVWKWLPAFVFVYMLNMLFCTINLWDLEATSAAYGAVKNNLLYAMIPLMLLRCDVRKLAKLGPKLLLTFIASVVTVCVGIVEPRLQKSMLRQHGRRAGRAQGPRGRYGRLHHHRQYLLLRVDCVPAVGGLHEG